MGNKTEQYWSEVNSLASEVIRLAVEIQGPLIDEHIDSEMAGEMNVDEIDEIVRSHYDTADVEAWTKLELRGAAVAIQFHTTPDEVLQDVWTIVSQTPHPLDSTPHH